MRQPECANPQHIFSIFSDLGVHFVFDRLKCIYLNSTSVVFSSWPNA